jgi:hypothetical protein
MHHLHQILDDPDYSEEEILTDAEEFAIAEVTDALTSLARRTLPDVELVVFQGGSEKVASRLDADLAAGRAGADILLVSDPLLYRRLHHDGQLLPYASPNATPIDRRLVDFDNAFVAARVSTMVIAHHPVYSNGSHGDTGDLIEAWGPLFEEHGVHAYLCGHDHDLQHLELEGLRTSFVLSGGGGARTRKMRTNDRAMPFGRDIYGFTHIQVLPDRLVFAHHGLEAELLHRFEKGVDGAVTIG